MNAEMIKYELELMQKGNKYIAGVDEVGRGSLAGPLVVAAVIINAKHLNEYTNLSEELELYYHIKDSKKLTELKRTKISRFLTNELVSYSLVEIDNNYIDKHGIMSATLTAFFRSVKKLKIKPDHVLTDSFEIVQMAKQSQTNLIRGDNKSISIAAASIIAKVYRDNLMVKMHNNNADYQVYGFDKHKGYGTKQHIEAIKKHGHSDFHRKSFKIG